MPTSSSRIFFPSLYIAIVFFLITTTAQAFFTSSQPPKTQTPWFGTASLIGGCKNPARPVPMFLGDVNAKYEGDIDDLSASITITQKHPLINPFSLQQATSYHSNPFKPLSSHHGGGGKRDPDENYEDTTKWSIYPQKSQNAHAVIGVLTCVTLYIWFCNVLGFLHLSKAFLIAGVVQMAQGLYLLSWLFYLLHPQDLVELHTYVVNDVMELQHMAISTCLLVAGAWDFVTGWLLHFQLPIYIDSYNRQIIRTTSTPIKQPNNLLFFQRYVPVVITVAHILNGANFISHPQHSDENTFGHVALGISMILGGFCFYWVRVRHKSWKHFTQQVYPSLMSESHMTRSFENNFSPSTSITMSSNGVELQDLTRVDNTLHELTGATYSDQYDPMSSATTTRSNNPPIHSNAANTTNNSNQQQDQVEVWTVGARYAIEDLQALGASGSSSRYGRRGINWSRFDIFSYDTTPPPTQFQQGSDDGDNLEDIDGTLSIANNKDVDTYRSAASNQSEWNGSILDVEYRKHLYPHLNIQFKWNSISTHRFVNAAYNSLQWVLHHLWYTKTRRELVATAFGLISTFNFCFIAWLLMTFIEPPISLHYSHWYECYTEINLVYTTLIVNYLLSLLAGLYLFLTIIHYSGCLRLPFLYRIPFFQK